MRHVSFFMSQTMGVGKTRETEQSVLNQSFDDTFQQLAVEQLGYDPTSNVLRRLNVDPLGNALNPTLTTQIDYAGGTNPTYIGQAAPGTALSAASWLIKKLTFDGNNNVTGIQYAGGAATFSQIWNNRASLTYS